MKPQWVPPRPAMSSTIDSEIFGSAAGFRVETAACSFKITGTESRRLSSGIRRSSEVTFRLDSFLERIRVKDEGLGLELIDEPRAAVHRHAVIELNESDVGVERGLGRYSA